MIVETFFGHNDRPKPLLLSFAAGTAVLHLRDIGNPACLPTVSGVYRFDQPFYYIT